jgi:ubiquinone/menaquinone biosynthesis C-methylase UbiE
VSEMVIDGFVAGVDHSEIMVEQARKRNAAAMRAGRVALHYGPASRVPYPEDSFDKIFAINVAQFWDDSEEVLVELRRVLRPGGLIALAVQPRSQGASERTARETGQKLIVELRAAGFAEVRLQSKKMKPVSTVCALGLKPEGVGRECSS